ncbi:MAG: hypothetical protein ACKVX7_12230 [Planctomycetota bacterium]
MNREHSNQRGVMLIIALLILTLILFVGVTFATLMRLESRATQNYRDTSITKMFAASAESDAISMLRGGLLWDGHISFNKARSPWLYGIKTKQGDLQLGDKLPLETVSEEECSLAGWVDASVYPGRGKQRYRTKIIDTSAQINLNSEHETLADMLDNLGIALASDPDYGTNPFFKGPKQTLGAVRGIDILRYRKKIGGRFQSKTQLKNIIGEVNYYLVADFVTAHSWTDQTTGRGKDGLSKYDQLFEGRPAATENELKTKITESGGLIPEPRSPINVNTASKPVLTACLMGLGGRRAYPYVDVTRQKIEEDNRGAIDPGAGNLPNEPEELVLQQIPVWVYSRPLSLDQAKNIALEIIKQRKTSAFTTWRSGAEGGAAVGFEDFINQLPEDLFPPPSSVQVVNPLNVRIARYRNQIVEDGSSIAGELWRRGHNSTEATERRNRGMAYSTKFAWYYEMMRSVLSANFNPNARINRFNPNATAYMPVDKSNLIKFENDDVTTPRPGHTTEFCFDANGIFEITTLADLVVDRNENEPGETYAEVKRYTVVKIWDTLRHTTQDDFETPFSSNAGRTSASDRQYVTTYPDPIDLLHENYFFGSRQDGRVELSGYADALLEGADVAARRATYDAQQSILAAHGFRYRDEQSRSQLARMLTRGSGSQELNKELTKVLDLNYSRAKGNFDLRYSVLNWGLNDSNVEDEILRDPKVGTANNGTDVFPDGLHSGIFRSTARGAPMYRFPASTYRNNPGDPGPMGATGRNDVGNLAYYQGGVAFWVKFEFDPRDPVFSGLLASTQVITRVGPSPNDSEGTQFFIYKNTSGQLRITRLYYHRAFQKGITDKALPYVDPAEAAEGGGDIVLDPQKIWARVDVVVDLVRENWKAHEWHHLVVQFNDQSPSQPIKVRLDDEEHDIVVHPLGEMMYCTVNVEEPQDGVFVGAFYRDQAVAGEGIFKFGTNLTEELVETAPSIKRILANATIDEFISFTGTWSSPFGPSGTGYFTDRPGKFANRFTVPFPDGIERIRLRSLAWSVYPPQLYRGQGVNWRAQSGGIRMSATNVGGNGSTVELREAGGDSQVDQLAGRWLYASSGGSTLGRTGEVIYQLQMTGARGIDKDGAKVVASPVLDDVTLTYYLPSAQVLVSETLE